MAENRYTVYRYTHWNDMWYITLKQLLYNVIFWIHCNTVILCFISNVFSLKLQFICYKTELIMFIKLCNYVGDYNNKSI